MDEYDRVKKKFAGMTKEQVEQYTRDKIKAIRKKYNNE